MRKMMLGLFLASIMMLGLVSAEVFPLYAGQDMEVGSVEVTNDDTNVYVKYSIYEDFVTEDWCLVETHLALKDNKDEFPASGKIKNLVPGQFEFGSIHDCVIEYEYSVPIGEWTDDNVLIAAHAALENWGEMEVCNPEIVGYNPVSMNVVSDTTNTYGEGSLAVAAWVHPAWTSNVDIPGATWIWTGEYVSTDEAVNGASNTFVKTFEIPADATNLMGSIKITTDNEYTLYVNDVEVGSDTNWQTVETYSVTLNPGTNEIKVLAVNIPLAGGVPTSNPGGVIYDLAVSYDVPVYEEVCVMVPYIEQTESAWAATAVGETRYNTKGNWATYVMYDLETFYKLLETLTVPATSGVGVDSSVLDAGKNYMLEASGTYRFANWGEYGIADAEWAYRSATYTQDGIAGWVKGEGYYSSLCGLDLQVGGCVDWGDFQESHVYKLDYAGNDESIHFFIYDNAYGDNSGSLTVKIYEKFW